MLVPTNNTQNKPKNYSFCERITMAFIRYFVAVPRIVLNDQTCSQTDKLVFGVINSLSNNKEYCYASNSYFSRVLDVGTKTISKSLSNLKKQNYIIIEYEKEQRRIFINPNVVSQENSKVSEKNFHEGMEEKFLYKRNSYTRKNIRTNNKEPIITKAIPCTKEQLEEMENLLKEYQ